MDALSYEYLLRRVYKVGRHGKDGADADIYRRMERAKRTLEINIESKEKGTIPISTLSTDELLYQYHSACAGVWGYVSQAIRDGLKEYGYLLTDEEKKQLTESIVEPPKRLVEKDYIDKAIKTAESIFAKYEIFPK
ncbi:hypothetical protein [Dysgonomonas sp. 520]|uniref:hypothetical protein n=1 Tax=Dysgonomonas sp. 520 TaxID=2302931 RepID=UPI0013D58786|nr:hypothetical protein [Dysgonomonas sp. 520]NDW11081.1 hypothetical protein [Dysgonomonas sp. 520]